MASDLVDASPQPLDLRLVRGDSFSFRLYIRQADGSPADLTDVAPAAQVRETPDAEEAAEFTANVAVDYIYLRLSSAQTQGLPEQGVWDCQAVWSDGTRTTVAGGRVQVLPAVTREPVP